MRHITLILPGSFNEAILVQAVEKFARRNVLHVQLCSPEAILSPSHQQLLQHLQALRVATTTRLCVTPEAVLADEADLVILACEQPNASSWPAAQRFVQAISRRSFQPVWAVGSHHLPPTSLTALILPDADGNFDPCTSGEVLRSAHILSQALDLPMDIVNVWYFLEEGLLRSWRIRMPEQEIAERRRRVAWLAQSGLARLLGTLPPDLTWRQLDCVRGRVIDRLEGALQADTLVVTGSEGRDGWAARLQANQAEDLCRRGKAQIVIVKKADNPASASLGQTTLPAQFEDDAYRPNPKGSYLKKRIGPR